MVSAGVHALLEQMKAENARLRADLASALRELADTRAALAAACAELTLLREQTAASNTKLGELTSQIVELTQQVAKGNDRVAELLVIAQRKHQQRKSKKDAPKDPPEPPEVGEDQQRAFDERPAPPPLRGDLHDRPRPRPRPSGRKPPPKHLGVDETTSYPTACACGCSDFDWVDEVIETKITVQEHHRVRRTHLKTGRCRRCRKRTTAEAPPSPYERSKVTCEYLSWIVVQRAKLLIPVNRLARYLGALGVALAKSCIVSMSNEAASLLDPIDGEHWKQILASGYVATDGTGIKVQVPGVGLHHGFFEVYHSGDIVVFQYTPEKGGETQASKLAGFKGALLVDAESRYNDTIRSNPDIVEYNCLAHPRRKLRDAEVAQPILAAEAGRFFTAMFDAEAEAKELGLTGDALRAWRQTKIKPIADDFHVWSDAVEPTLLPKDPLAVVLGYCDNHWKQLTGFIDNPRVDIDNSGSERLFQPVAQYRDSSLFAGGTEGAHTMATLLGIVATCTRTAVNPEAYLTWVFERRGTHRHKFAQLTAADLTPAAYKRWLTAQQSGP